VSRRDDERVADILDAASEIAEIIELGRDAWDKDRIRRLAVERLLEIIGEAANSAVTPSERIGGAVTNHSHGLHKARSARPSASQISAGSRSTRDC
jgi:uncharacterized protein with HEPN domain